MRLNMDIDIDVPDRNKILSILPHTPASAIRDSGSIDKHNSGVYFQQIPVDPDSGYSSIDFKDAEELGYMKFDFLNNTLYQGVRDPDHLDELISMEPDWDMLKDLEIVNQLHHIHNYYDLINKFEPRNIDELAALIALIRPAKKYLQNSNKTEIMDKIWLEEDEGYAFKKSHSYAYALSIIVQMNLISEQINAL